MDQEQEGEKRRLLEEIDGEYRRMEEITMRRDVHPIEIEAHEKYIADLKHRLWRIEPTPARQREEDIRVFRILYAQQMGFVDELMRKGSEASAELLEKTMRNRKLLEEQFSRINKT